MKTTVVIPTYNEKDNISKLLDSLVSLYPDFDIYIIDDNSPDGTSEIVKQRGKQNSKIHLISRTKKEGIGRAYIHGFTEVLNKEPDCEYIVQMDADFSHDPEAIKQMLEEIQENDLVIGSRYINGISVVNWPLSRVLLSWFASFYVRLVTGLKIMDATSGFKCHKVSMLRQINLEKIKSDGYIFQVEMNYVIKKLGFKIRETPIIFVDRHAGTSKLSSSIIKEALFNVLFLPFKKIKKYDKKHF